MACVYVCVCLLTNQENMSFVNQVNIKAVTTNIGDVIHTSYSAVYIYVCMYACVKYMCVPVHACTYICVRVPVCVFVCVL